MLSNMKDIKRLEFGCFVDAIDFLKNQCWIVSEGKPVPRYVFNKEIWHGLITINIVQPIHDFSIEKESVNDSYHVFTISEYKKGRYHILCNEEYLTTKDTKENIY